MMNFIHSQQEFETESKVIELLNKFGQAIIPKYIPLKYSIKDNMVMFKYAKDRLIYLRFHCEIYNMENSFNHLSCFAFQALFLNSDNF